MQRMLQACMHLDAITRFCMLHTLRLASTYLMHTPAPNACRTPKPDQTLSISHGWSKSAKWVVQTANWLLHPSVGSLWVLCVLFTFCMGSGLQALVFSVSQEHFAGFVQARPRSLSTHGVSALSTPCAWLPAAPTRLHLPQLSD